MTETSPKLETISQVDLVQQAHSQLLDLIALGDLKPGDRLNEVDLAKQMGISRGPVREAARLLERGGFVRSEPRRGFFVCDIAVDDIGHLYELRCSLEVFAAKAIVTRLTPDQTARFHNLQAKLEIAAEHDKPLECMELTFSLHRLFCEYFGNPKMLETFDTIVWQTRQIVTFVNQLDKKSSHFLAEQNRPIIDAVDKGDVDTMEATLLKYFGNNIEDLEDYFQRNTSDQNKPDRG